MLRSRWLKIAVFLLCLVPLGWLGWRAYNGNLTANPIEFITHFTGDWAIRFLVISLAVTPLRRTLGQPDLIRFRRMLGLFAFFYATLHFSTWLVLDKFFDWPEILRDFTKRRFIIMGLLAFSSMVPLAITSTKGWIRRLGKRWQLLHRLVYLSAIAAVVHYWWLVKSDIREPALYGAIVAIELVYRLVTRVASSSKKAPVALAAR